MDIGDSTEESARGRHECKRGGYDGASVGAKGRGIKGVEEKGCRSVLRELGAADDEQKANEPAVIHLNS